MRRPAEVVFVRFLRITTVGRAEATHANWRLLPQLVLKNAPKRIENEAARYRFQHFLNIFCLFCGGS